MADQLPTFTVHLTIPVSTAVEVQAESIDAARDAALCEAPAPTNSSNKGIDPTGEWTEFAVYDEDGEQVWSQADDDELHAAAARERQAAADAEIVELRAEVERLRRELASRTRPARPARPGVSVTQTLGDVAAGASVIGYRAGDR